MNSVELVKQVCKEKRIPISRLERDLGYSNGYIGQLRKGVFPTNRLVEIADYLSVSVDYLLGTEKEKAPTPEGERSVPHSKYREVLAEGGIRLMLDEDANVPKDHIDDIVEFIKFKQRKNGQ